MDATREALQRSTMQHRARLGGDWFSDLSNILGSAGNGVSAGAAGGAVISDVVYNGSTLYFQSDYSVDVNNPAAVSLEQVKAALRAKGYQQVTARVYGYWTTTAAISFQLTGGNKAFSVILADVVSAGRSGGFGFYNPNMNVTYSPPAPAQQPHAITTTQLDTRNQLIAAGLNPDNYTIDAQGLPHAKDDGTAKSLGDSFADFVAKIGIGGAAIIVGVTYALTRD